MQVEGRSEVIRAASVKRAFSELKRFRETKIIFSAVNGPVEILRVIYRHLRKFTLNIN
jgi:hypothetical protein